MYRLRKYLSVLNSTCLPKSATTPSSHKYLLLCACQGPDLCTDYTHNRTLGPQHLVLTTDGTVPFRDERGSLWTWRGPWCRWTWTNVGSRTLVTGRSSSCVGTSPTYRVGGSSWSPYPRRGWSTHHVGPGGVLPTRQPPPDGDGGICPDPVLFCSRLVRTGKPSGVRLPSPSSGTLGGQTTLSVRWNPSRVRFPPLWRDPLRVRLCFLIRNLCVNSNLQSRQWMIDMWKSVQWMKRLRLFIHSSVNEEWTSPYVMKEG